MQKGIWCSPKILCVCYTWSKGHRRTEWGINHCIWVLLMSPIHIQGIFGYVGNVLWARKLYGYVKYKWFEWWWDYGRCAARVALPGRCHPRRPRNPALRPWRLMYGFSRQGTTFCLLLRLLFLLFPLMSWLRALFREDNWWI
jgi:hypothetical protein